jgi:hypothetical protein
MTIMAEPSVNPIMRPICVEGHRPLTWRLEEMEYPLKKGRKSAMKCTGGGVNQINPLIRAADTHRCHQILMSWLRVMAFFNQAASTNTPSAEL